jgi:hypothetical protein
MEVEYGLTRPRADVQDCTVALLDIAPTGDLSSREVATANNFGVRGFRFFQSCKMFLGDDKDVSWRLRANVFEGEDVIVFVDLGCRDLAANDAAEKAGSGWISHKKNPARSNNNTASGRMPAWGRIHTPCAERAQVPISSL